MYVVKYGAFILAQDFSNAINFYKYLFAFHKSVTLIIKVKTYLIACFNRIAIHRLDTDLKYRLQINIKLAFACGSALSISRSHSNKLNLLSHQVSSKPVY